MSTTSFPCPESPCQCTLQPDLCYCSPAVYTRTKILGSPSQFYLLLLFYILPFLQQRNDFSYLTLVNVSSTQIHRCVFCVQVIAFFFVVCTKRPKIAFGFFSSFICIVVWFDYSLSSDWSSLLVRGTTFTTLVICYHACSSLFPQEQRSSVWALETGSYFKHLHRICSLRSWHFWHLSICKLALLQVTDDGLTIHLIRNKRVKYNGTNYPRLKSLTHLCCKCLCETSPPF